MKDLSRTDTWLLAAAGDAAKRDGLVPAVITFDPHPREFFRQEDAPFHLADRTEKDRLLSNLDVDRIIHVSFDEALRRTDAKDFVSSVLPALGVKQLYAGSDFAFGRGRGGQIDTINDFGASVVDSQGDARVASPRRTLGVPLVTFWRATKCGSKPLRCRE